jgi:arabinan endo-1,5-alpha-L-arabinosidase
MGKLFISSEIGVLNSIDPFFIEDNGKNYLFWGSYGGGIWSVEMSADGLSIKEGAKKVQVAADTYEGTYIHKKGNYYYLFASINNCCDGFNSIYTTVVGRSESLHGPYLNKKGESMRTGFHHEVVIEGDGVNFFGTGHNSEIVTDKNGDDWIMYHAYAKVVGGRSRTLMLDKVTWKDGWPEVNAGYPSEVADRPVF